MAGIKDAIVEVLQDNSRVRAWATDGIYAKRAGQRTPGQGVRDKYITVRVSDSDPNDSHTQDGPATVTTDRIEVAVWALGGREADIGANEVRWALDGWFGSAAGYDFVQRIFWRVTVDREVEDASGAEQEIHCCLAEFDVAYTLPTVQQQE